MPADNPFKNSSVYSYGQRNPQGLTTNPWTGDIWETEHGPRGGDEINLIKAGKNYGWPVITYGINYSGTPITNKTTLFWFFHWLLVGVGLQNRLLYQLFLPMLLFF